MNYLQQKRQHRRTVWIYIRYAFPILAILLILLAMRIPCLQFTTADTGKNDVISAWELMGNAWDQARECLFGGMEDPTQASIAFSKVVLTTVIVCHALFWIGSAIAVWALVTAVRCSRSPKEGDRWRIAFITIAPNRTSLCLWLLCLLPLSAFPRLLIIIYETMMNYTVTMNVTFAEPLIIALLLWFLQIVLSAATANAERELDMDLFQTFSANHRKKQIPNEKTENPVSCAKMTQKDKEEQLDKIRQLLRDEDTKNE